MQFSGVGDNIFFYYRHVLFVVYGFDTGKQKEYGNGVTHKVNFLLLHIFDYVFVLLRKNSIQHTQKCSCGNMVTLP